MQIGFDFFVVFLGMIISSGIFAGSLLLISKTNALANRFLGLLVFGFSLWLCDSFFSLAGIYRQNPNYYFLPIYFSLGFGPLIYFYTRSLVFERPPFSRVDLLHFVPVFLQLLLYLVLQTGDYGFRRWFWMEVHEPYTYNLEFNLSLLSLVIYLFKSYRLLGGYQTWIKDQFSEISKINLDWLRKFFVAMIILSFFWFLEAFLRTLFDYFPDAIFTAFPMGILVLFLAAGGLRQHQVGGTSKMAIDPGRPMTPPIDQQVLQSIVEAMEKRRYFLDPELSLKTFSQQVGLNDRVVSNTINGGLKMPFIDFVNKHRIDTFMQLSKTEEVNRLSLLGMALESGFNSKSTFNRVFKKMTGESPSQHLRRQAGQSR
ncbi:helix-turn-helix domain-containing protein [Flagellimonas sp. DF-77]|uniref:helix-turn-helix domain-containing protein n=1 Tax=Flagellimonas algarum TaxID=3230298 RepID=UPI003398F649